MVSRQLVRDAYSTLLTLSFLRAAVFRILLGRTRLILAVRPTHRLDTSILRRLHCLKAFNLEHNTPHKPARHEYFDRNPNP